MSACSSRSPSRETRARSEGGRRRARVYRYVLFPLFPSHMAALNPYDYKLP